MVIAINSLTGTPGAVNDIEIHCGRLDNLTLAHRWLEKEFYDVPRDEIRDVFPPTEAERELELSLS